MPALTPMPSISSPKVTSTLATSPPHVGVVAERDLVAAKGEAVDDPRESLILMGIAQVPVAREPQTRE
jgi:hypothetical protein